MVVLVAQELVTLDEGVDTDTVVPGIVRRWGSRPQRR